MSKRALSLLFLALVAAGWALPAVAQQAAPRTGWYVVRPGDTLIGITRRFLGSSERWLENWQLNPEVEDPHRLAPGQRLRLLLGVDLPRRAARVATLSRNVDEILAPMDWSDASLDDLLLQRDGVRTQAASSVELELSAGSRMQITENSLVYLKEVSRTPASVPRQTIEIVEGQADLEAVEPSAAASDIEILIGGTVAKPKSAPGRPAQARARRPETGGAQLMVYRGDSEVEAAGETVEVPQGMGTSVPKGGPPGPPEELLPAPVPRAPQAGARVASHRPTLVWEEVAGAVDYTVEVCGDPSCGALVRRVVGHRDTRWQADELPNGKLFWRATATSPSGLDGYPGESRPLEIVEGPIDSQPPQLALKARGKSLVRDAVHYLGVGGELEVEVRDAGSEISRQRLLLDGQSVSPGILRGPWEPGRHELTFDVTDAAGNVAEVGARTFVYDPDPPSISWQSVDAGWRGDEGMTVKAWPRGRGSALVPDAEGEASPKAKDSRKKRAARRKNGSSGNAREVELSPLLWSGAGWGWQNLDRSWQADGAVAHLLLRSTEPLTLEGPGLRLAPGERLMLSFEDATGVGGLRFAALSGEDGGAVLELEIRDLLGNVRTERWRILRD